MIWLAFGAGLVTGGAFGALISLVVAGAGVVDDIAEQPPYPHLVDEP